MAGERRSLLVSKGWVQMVILVVLVGFFVLGLLAYSISGYYRSIRAWSNR